MEILLTLEEGTKIKQALTGEIKAKVLQFDGKNWVPIPDWRDKLRDLINENNEEGE